MALFCAASLRQRMNYIWYATEEGDDESVAQLKQLPDWQCVGNPSAIEAQEAKSRRPYIEPGNRFKHVTPRQGLVCLDAAQELGTKCKNYRVRFCCQPPPLPPPPPPPAAEAKTVRRGRQNRVGRFN